MKKRTMKKRALSLLLALVLAAALLPVAALAADGPARSGNSDHQLYRGFMRRWDAPIESYLFENERGGLTRVEYIPQKGFISQEHIVVEDYDSSFQFLSGQEIPMELEIWGGFFAGETCNFFVFGQKNPEEDNNREVIRVVKYSKDWQRLGQASLCGANTTVPFRSGSLRFAEYNGMLYIRTSHEMYKSSDGLNHQANLTIAVRESDMTVTDSAHAVANSGANYVSHSFNQFILVDHEQRIVSLDHGDAYPRAAVLGVFAAKAGEENITKGAAKAVTIQSFPGATGDNTTGATLSGLAETSSGYIVSYDYDGVGGGGASSAYLAYVDKNSLSVETRVISNPGEGASYLIPTGLDGGYVMINTSDGIKYAKYSADGSVGEFKTVIVRLSDCQPIIYNGKVVWYTTFTENVVNASILYTTPTFFQLDENGAVAVKARLPLGGSPFADVSETDYFSQSVYWAVEQGITTGTGDGTTFSPGQTCTTAQFLTFLWRALDIGKPMRITASPFVDVNESDYFYDAVLWAYQSGWLSVDGSKKFKPDSPCTRAMAMEFLYKAMYSPGSYGFNCPYTDIAPDASYSTAVAWAAITGITTGTGDGTTFSPDQTCTRAEIVTFFHRLLA